MPKAETPLTPPAETPENLATALEAARSELALVNAEIIRTQALAETERRLQTERHTRSLAAEYQRVMESAVITKQEADTYAKSLRATIDEEAKTERQRRVDEAKGHAMKMSHLGKQHRETLKQYAVEERSMRAELDRLSEDKAGELEARFAKASKFLAGIDQALNAVAEQILGTKIQPLAGKPGFVLPAESNYSPQVEVPN